MLKLLSQFSPVALVRRLQAPRVIAAVAISATLPLAAEAGVPQAGTFLTGRILRGNTLITEGTLEWEYTPLQGGQPVRVRTSLRPLKRDGAEPLSYSVLIPLEQTVQSQTPTSNRLQLSNVPLRVQRRAFLNGQELRIFQSKHGETFSINQRDHLGSLEMVDLVLPSTTDCCPGDATLDRFVNVDDFIAIRNNFGNPLPLYGDANCDAFVNTNDYISVRENFGHFCFAAPTGLRAQTDIALASTKARARHRKLTTMEAAVSLEVPPGSYNVGDTLTVAVRGDFAATGATAAGFFIAFDHTRLKFESGTASGHLHGSPFTGTPDEVAEGVIAFSLGLEQAGKGDPTLATLTFTTLAEGSARVEPLVSSPVKTRILDEQFNDVSASLIGTTATINPGSQTRLRNWELY